MSLRINVALAAALIAGAVLAATVNAEEPSLARIQQILTAKKMVDLTHAFEPGIPRWSGFPDEKREVRYWYEKGRGSMGEGFLPSSSRMWGNGARMWIRRRISSRDYARWIRSSSRK